MALNNRRGPFLIMAGSGMCNGGRILHHLKHNLHDPSTAVLFVGFQSPGTLGRKLVDGAEEVKIFGEEIAVRASVHTLGGFSAHADQQGLFEWFAAVAPSKPSLFIIHGENGARKTLAARIRSELGIRAQLPELGAVLEI